MQGGCGYSAVCFQALTAADAHFRKDIVEHEYLPRAGTVAKEEAPAAVADANS